MDCCLVYDSCVCYVRYPQYLPIGIITTGSDLVSLPDLAIDYWYALIQCH